MSNFVPPLQLSAPSALAIYGQVQVIENIVPSAYLAHYTGKTAMASITIPPLQPWSEVHVQFGWSMTPSANVKTVYVEWNGVDLGITDARGSTTQGAATQDFYIRNMGATNVQCGPNAQQQGTVGPSFPYFSADTTKPVNLVIKGNLDSGAASSADQIRIEWYRVEITNRNPNYPMSRIFPGQSIFYGANGHFDDGATPAQIIASLKSMQMTSARYTWEGDTTSLNFLKSLAAAFVADGTGLKLYACLDISTVDASTGVTFASETLAYNYGKAQGITAATALNPYASCIMAYELGNEMTRKDNIALNPVYQGTNITDFSNAKWPMLRGVISGCLDGVKSIAPTALCASNAFTFSEYCAADMLFYGQQPDGTTGHRAINWDITAIHSYHSWGDPMNEYYDGGGTGPQFDYVQRMMQYGKPIVVSEFNGDGGSQSDADLSNWIWKMYTQFTANKFRYNIAATFVYQLYGSPWGVISPVGSTTRVVTFGNTVYAWIHNTPDTGN